MRTLRYFFITALWLGNCMLLRAQGTADDAKAIALVKEFFTTYMYQMASSNPPSEQGFVNLEKKYCTARLVTKIKNEQTKVDPFIKAQDCDSAWVKTLQVVKFASTPNQYTVAYTADNKITIHVALVPESGALKIDKVW